MTAAKRRLMRLRLRQAVEQAVTADATAEAVAYIGFSPLCGTEGERGGKGVGWSAGETLAPRSSKVIHKVRVWLRIATCIFCQSPNGFR